MKKSALAVASLLLAAPLHGGELKGRVLAADRPASGVTVAAFPYEAPRDEARRLARDGAAPKAVASAQTRADGTFTLAVPHEPGAKETLVALEVSGGGVAALRLDDVFTSLESEDVGDLLAARGEPLAGRVADSAGAPVGDAEVVLLGPARDGERPASVTTRSGADGGFRFDAAAAGARILVRKAGWAAEAARVSPGILARPIVLSPGVTLAGVVRRPDGRTPASGALVRFDGAAPGRWVEAGEDGAFRIADLPRGKGRLVVDGGDAGYRELPAAAGSEAPLAVVLRPASALAGRVVDARSGRPLARVKLTLTSAAGTLTARSAPDGRYAFRPLAAGTFALKADEPRYVAWSTSELAVGAGAERKLDVPLTLGATLAGRVVDEAGRPVAGARGSLSREQSSGLAALMRAARGEEPSAFRSAADGTFRATRLAPGGNQRLLFRHPEHERALVGGISLSGGAVKAGVTVVMKRGATLTGRVVDAGDRPVAGADVELSAPMGTRRGRGGMVAVMGGPGNLRAAAKTGADGGFELKGVVPGDHALSVSKSGYATARLDVVKVKDGEPTPPVNVRLAKGAAIRGFVRRPDGGGAEGYIVTTGLGRGGLGLGRGGRPPEPTGPDGAFALEGLTDGESYDLSVVSGTGLGPQKRGVTAPADGVVIDVGGAGSIKGRALEASSGRPVADYAVSYEPDMGGGAGRMIRVASRAVGGPLAGAGERVDVHAEDGSFTIEDVPAGTWSVVFSAPGYQNARVGSIVVEEGKTRDGVEGRLARGTRLTGRVTDAQDGRAVPGATIAHELVGSAPMRLPGLDAEAGVTTDADGRFDIGELAPGKYQVTARHPDYTDASASVDVADQAASVDLQLAAGGALGGVVLTEARQPAAGVEVELEAAGGGGFARMMFGGGRSTITDPSGRFRFEHLSPSRYTATASARGKTSAPVETVLAAGESRDDLVLSLETGTTIRGSVAGLPSSLVSGVNVTASGPDSFFASSRTGSDGRFEISGAPPGAITLRATAGDLSRTRTALKQVTIGGEEPAVDVEVVFEDGLRISGTVTKRGAAAPGAMVAAMQQGGGGRSASAQADERGAYQLDGLHEGTYSVVASLASAGGGAKRQTVTLTDDLALDLAIPSGTISGTVVEAGSRAPLDGATIDVDTGEGGGPVFRMRTTDSNGRFTLSDLEEKSYTLTFRRPGFQFEKRTANASESGGEELVVELTRGEGIGIQVLDGIYGVPLHGVLARVTDAQRTAVFTGAVALDEQGRGEIPSLKPGRYAVFLDASGYAPANLPAVDVPQPTLRVAMTPGGVLEIHAGPETLAKGSAACQLLGADGAPMPFSLFGGDGRFTLVTPVRRLENLAPGSYYLAAGSAAPRPFSIAEGMVTPLTLP